MTPRKGERLSVSPRLRVTFLVLTTMASVIASFAILGWINNSFEPTSFTFDKSLPGIGSAVSLLVLSIGMYATVGKWHSISIPISVVVLAICTISIFQSWYNADLGVNQYLLSLNTTSYDHSNSLMTNETAICFVAASLFLISVNLSFPKIWQSLISNLLASSVAGFGLIALFTYILPEKTSTDWASILGFSSFFILGVLALGLAMLIYSHSLLPLTHSYKLFWNLIPVSVFLFVVSFELYRVLDNNESKIIQRSTNAEVKQFANTIEGTLNTSILALQRMAIRWETQGGTSKEVWEFDALNYVEDFRIFTAISWIDKKYKMRWIVPSDQAQKIASSSSASNHKRFQAMQKAKTTGEITIAQSIKRLEGGSDFQVFLPLFLDEEFQGFIVGVFSMSGIIQEILTPEIRNRFSLQIFNQDNLLFELSQPEENLLRRTVPPIKLIAKDAIWNLHMSLSEQAVSNQKSEAPVLVFALSILISISTVVLLYFIQESRNRAETLAVSNDQLHVLNKNLDLANKELDQFAYAASHDLKSPLRGIHQLANWIEDDLEGKLDDQTRSYLEQLKNRIVRLQNLLSSLLDYAKAGKDAKKQKQVSTEDLLTNVISILSIPDKFTVNIATRMPVILINEGLFQQIFMNLLTNAINHHDKEHGVITISYSNDNNMHHFYVADDGPGIPIEFQEKVFQMFETLKPRDEVEGSGMGLAFIKKAIHSLGGDIVIKSDPSQKRGTTFDISWPEREKEN